MPPLPGARQLALLPPSRSPFVDDTERIFGSAPRRLAYDRGGHSAPNVRSTHMMMTAGQSSIFGYNLNRLVSLAASKDGVAPTGA